MSMEHRAFAFDWTRFESGLLPVLVRALESDDQRSLESYIDEHQQMLRDPYEGEPLPRDWRVLLGNGDVQELADFALTQYYRPEDDRGLGAEWRAIDDLASPAVSSALLGQAIGPHQNRFDPGRMGSYFQPPAAVKRSVQMLANADLPRLSEFLKFLRECVGERRGVYVTF